MVEDERAGRNHRSEFGVTEGFEESEQVVVERFGGEIFAGAEVAGEQDGVNACVERCSEKREPCAFPVAGEDDVRSGVSLG